MTLLDIATAAARECERQGVDEHALIRLLDAHARALEVANESRIWSRAFVWDLARRIEPDIAYEYRTTPVTFASGGWAAHPDVIESAMDRWVQHVEPRPSQELAELQVKALLDIHPYRDGNGRLAWVLYNWMLGTLTSPRPLPDFYPSA